MDYKCLLLALLAFALTVGIEASTANTSKEELTGDSTESPIVDLAAIVPEIKSPTERPPIENSGSMPPSQNGTAAMKDEPKQVQNLQNVQPHTVADFIIHPLIAFKPRAPEEIGNTGGKQAGTTSSTTPAPWSIFGFSPGQGLGSLAGSVSGWFTDRIPLPQFPGFVESPIRGPSSTTTTTTPRPDVIVQVQHKPTARRPLISINNRERPQNFQTNTNFAADEYDDDEYDYEDEEFVNNNNNKNRRKNNNNNNNNNNRRKPNRPVEVDEDDSPEEAFNQPIHRPQQNQAPKKQRRRRPGVVDDFSEEEGEEDDEDTQPTESEDDAGTESDEQGDVEEYEVERPNRRRVPAQNNNKRRWVQQQQQRPYNGENQRRKTDNVRRPIQRPESDELEDEEYDDSDDDLQFYYGSRPSTKRSQNEANFFQRRQENIINQIRQLTRGQFTPAEISALIRQTSATKTKQTADKSKRRQQQQAAATAATTLLVNRNGETIYLAPELLNVDLPLAHTQKVHPVAQSASPKSPKSPLKRKNAPKQYITIPWSQLGISPPDQLHSVTDGAETQPLILNIPASALEALQSQSLKRKSKPSIAAEVVPLLAEASVVDVFKPPTFPNDRDTAADMKAHEASAGVMPVVIATNKKTSTSSAKSSKTSNLPQRIRSGTIVEKARESDKSQLEAAAAKNEPESARKLEKKYILVGEDADPERQVQPVLGDARFVFGGANASPYQQLLRSPPFALRRNGRELKQPEHSDEQNKKDASQLYEEQQIPVQIINEPQIVEQPKESNRRDATNTDRNRRSSKGSNSKCEGAGSSGLMGPAYVKTGQNED